MPKIELNKSYNSSQLTELENSWTDFEGHSGSEVELFLKDKLEDSVVNFKYHSTGYETPDTKEVLNNVLVGLNAFGKEICYEQVINADPTYTADFVFQNVIIGSNTYTEGTSTEAIQVNKSDNLTAKTTFKYLLTGNIAGNEFNETSAQSITFKWFKDSEGNNVDALLDTLTRTISPGESVSVDLTPMFNNAFLERYLGVVFKVPKSDVEITKVFKVPFTLRKLELSYKGLSLIRTPILTNINLEGTMGESLENYTLQYYIDTVVGSPKTQDLTSGTQSNQIILDLTGINEGAHDVFVRAKNKANLTSNYIQISFIYQASENSKLTDAIAMVTEVPDEISNCNLSKFFKVVTTDKLSGNIEIVALKSSNQGNIYNINSIEEAKASPYLFKEISLSLLNTDPSQPIDYTSYIEIPGNTDTTEYLKILVKNGDGEVKSLNYFQAGSTVGMSSYKRIMIKNPTEGSEHLQYTKGEILGFSQISNGNVFTDLNPNLDSSDGLQLETVSEGSEEMTMTAFKVSPTEGVFTTPKKLVSAGQSALHKQAFSIEMMFKTYGSNDLDDKILTIGNITLCPKHIFVNHEPDKTEEPHFTVNASRADFRKEVIQHLVITYDPEYKPNTYDQLYDKFFTLGDTSYTKNAQSYPCLKFYVNGTINRIISIGSDTICSESDFKLQIHPTNSNINFYIFRTYDRALSYEEVKKNRLSSILKLVEKQKVHLENDILYTESDFTAGQLSEKSSILNTISLGKCINKFKSVGNPNKIYLDRKVLLLVLPPDTLPPYYGNRKKDEPKAAFLVHYPEVKTNSGYQPSAYSGSLTGGKVKAQGSSAKKYIIHNTSYSKFTFTPESESHKEEPQTYDYYKMPGSDIEIAKLVGKVNYASSMQSHKQGATKLFHEGYVSPNLGMDTSWMNGGRKAVLEDDFLYFFVNVPEEDVKTITWDYFKQEDGSYNFENCHFLGFQTWGSAKGDKPTSGYDKKTPYYLMLEGADNDNAAANFKTPWASMQIWGKYNGNDPWSSADTTIIQAPTDNPSQGLSYYHQFEGGVKDTKTGLWKPDYITGLLVKDETIVFDPGTESGNSSDKRADAWDVDFGITEGASYSEDPENLFFEFEKKVQTHSLKKFAEFYNLVYTFDFSSLIYIKAGSTINGNSMLINDNPSYQYKLLFGPDCTITYNDKTVTPAAGDIYRWEKAWPSDVAANSQAKWVPAGLYHNGTDWESLNIATICNWYKNAARKVGQYPEEYAFFANDAYKNLKAIGDNGEYKYVINGDYTFNGYSNSVEEEIKNMQACMAEAFKIAMHEYLDIDDVSYHQAFIKLVAGTDNRAKNTYFQIVGPIYTDKYVNDMGKEVSLIKFTGGDYADQPGYVDEGSVYLVNVSNGDVVETGESFDASGISESKPWYYKESGDGDFKIRLYQDDLDTIFKTDNNGQQVKPYYLLEPPYDKTLEHLWGDMHSGFFYNYDLLFTEEIKTKLGKLLDFATDKEWPDSPNTKFYEYFFSIQKNIPSIAYNHQSEIYYESTQTLWQNGNPTPFYTVFEKSGEGSWKDFSNNKVQNPVSLSHGSCLEAEVEYLRDRVLLLSTYTNTAKNQTDTSIKLDGGSATTQGSQINIASEYTSFIQYIYPIINNISSTKEVTDLNYDPLLDYVSWNGDGYNKIGLVYDIALPNKPLDISVTFTTSSLTTNSYWTSTDLYRTIHITSGAESFSQLFDFPNASTVISQDPNYQIYSAESKEINVVDYLESIEHLVLQNASVTSIGFDFTGCNRLKTLVLGKTYNLTTEQGLEEYGIYFEDVLDKSKVIKVAPAEATTGFKQVILPKSQSLEQLILPNCVQVVNMQYYPKLTRLEFNEGTELVNLTIDGRNKKEFIEYIIDNFVGAYTNTLEITNVPENFWLSEDICCKLAYVQNVKIVGTIKIGDGIDTASISWKTKQLLVEKFGDIVNGNMRFNYRELKIFTGNTIKTSTTGIIEAPGGTAPLNLAIPGNDIPIEYDSSSGKYHLKIHYSIKDSSGMTPDPSTIKFADKWTPRLIIADGVEGVYTVTTTVFYSNTSKACETELTVGFRKPEVGDFAYANGTFSSVCDPSLGIVGVVFYCNQLATSPNVTYDVRVLSAKASSTDYPLGPAKYGLDWGNTYAASNKKRDEQESYRNLLDGLTPENVDDFYSDVAQVHYPGWGIDTTNSITYDTTLKTLVNTEELELQKDYVKRANLYLSGLSAKIDTVPMYIETDSSKLTEEGKTRFQKALQAVSNIASITTDTGTYTKASCGRFDYALYPAYLMALYYEPDNLTEKGKDYFGLGNWYIPDTDETTNLIIYRINSSMSNTTNTEDMWNATAAATESSTGAIAKYKVFKSDAFDNIAFLKDSSPRITSVCNSDGECYTYHREYNSSSYKPKWLLGISAYDWYSSSYQGKYRAKDEPQKIYPVCRIELIKQ